MDARTPSPLPVDHALAAIEQVGPRHYQVTGLAEGEPLYFFVLGCQGEEGVRQNDVARIMNEVAEQKRPSFILFLGDNIYGGAVQSTQDERFNSRFHNVYNLKELAPIPGLLILGNHDANLENSTYYSNRFFFNLPGINYIVNPYTTGKNVEKFEVAHTYLHKGAEFYKNNALPIHEMPKWNMPYYYSSYHFVGTNTQLFCLNSNSYVNDFIRYLSADNMTDNSEDTENQTVWFDAGFFEAKKSGRTTLVATHNPLITSSKRALPEKYDAHLYLSSKQIQQMNYVLKIMASGKFTQEKLHSILKETDTDINTKVGKMLTNGSYADMLYACFKIQGIKPDIVFAAHDHDLVYNCSNELCQVISGAGGSTNLMRKHTDKHHATEGCFISEPGFVAVTCNSTHPTPSILFDFHTTNNQHLQFTNASHEPTQSSVIQYAMHP